MGGTASSPAPLSVCRDADPNAVREGELLDIAAAERSSNARPPPLPGDVQLAPSHRRGEGDDRKYRESSCETPQLVARCFETDVAGEASEERVPRPPGAMSPLAPSEFGSQS